MNMPPLETERLLIRPFVPADLDAVYRILDVELGPVEHRDDDNGKQALAARREWLQWSILNYAALAKLDQPPYGDRAIVLKRTQQLIGACGYAPTLLPFEQLPYFAGGQTGAPVRNTSEVGLYWAVSPAHQRQGFATEAGRALIDYAFTQLNLKRIVATTTYDNVASTGIMRKLGLHVERNPQPAPPWLQVVGVLANA